MKASEISIGNWVEWLAEPCKVDTGLLVTEFPFKVTQSDYVKPIHITEEFLKKNGFERDEFVFDISNKAIYNLKKDEFSILIYKGANKGDEYYQAHVDDKCGCTIGNADIRYVHQLQNLLNLLEIEWEVNV